MSNPHLHKKLYVFLACAFLASGIFAQESVPANTTSIAEKAQASLPALSSRLPAAWQNLLAASAQEPLAPFSADVLLKAAAALPASAAGQREALLDAAWQDMRDAQETLAPYPLVHTGDYHAEGTATDRTYVSGLDRLSLQSRIVQAMEAVNPAKASIFYKSISLADLPIHANCDVTTLADPSIYYEASGEMVKTEISESAKITWLRDKIQSADGEMSVAPVLALVVNIGKLSPENQQSVSLMLSAMLDRIRGEDVAFTKSSAAVDANIPLVLQLLSPTANTTAQLKASFGAYLQAHYTAMRCAQSLDSEAFAQEQQSLSGQISELGLKDIDHKPAGMLSHTNEAQDNQLGQEYYAQAWGLLKDILNGPSPNTLNDEQKRAVNYLVSVLLDDKLPDDAQYHRYLNRCGAVRKLMTSLPDGDTRLMVGRSYIQLLAASPVYKADPIEWFYDVRSLMADIEAMEPAKRADFRTMLQQSRNPVLSLYADLDALPQAPPENGSSTAIGSF